MLRSLTTKTIRDERRALLWWCVGLAAMASWTIGWFGTYSKSAGDMARFFERAPAALKAFFGGEFDMGTAVGYLRMEMFSFMAPLLLTILAIGAGSRAIAGEERKGTLDLLLSNPIPRRRVVAGKMAAMLLLTFALTAVLGGVLIAGATLTGMDIDLLKLASATFAAGVFAAMFGSLALMIGAATGSKGASVGVPAAIAVAGYLLYGLSDLVPALEPWRWISPFTYYAETDVLKNGIQMWHAGVLVGLTLFFAYVAVVVFERRDIAT